MPPDCGTRLILRYEYVLECLWGKRGKLCCLVPEASKESGDVFGLLQLTYVEVVTPAKRHGSSFADKSTKLKFAKL